MRLSYRLSDVLLAGIGLLALAACTERRARPERGYVIEYEPAEIGGSPVRIGESVDPVGGAR